LRVEGAKFNPRLDHYCGQSPGRNWDPQPNRGDRICRGAVRYPLACAQTRAASLAVLVIISAALCPPLAAQDRSRIWLGAGLGSAGRTDGAGGVAVMGEVVYQHKRHQFAVRGLLAADPLGENGDEFGEVGLLYGRVAIKKSGHASIAGGLAVTAVSPCRTRSCTTLGFPIVGEVSARIGSVLGVGLQGFANINTRSSYAGFALLIQLGWMP
jgi:hypothetical protein